MIITIKGADFSAKNIGTLSAWTILTNLGSGATYSGNRLVDKDGSLSATITIANGYELGSAGVSVIMGTTNVTSSAVTVNGNIITVSIATVTNNVTINVPTLVTGGENGGGESTSWYPVDPETVTASGAQLGANCAFIKPIVADTESHHFTHFNATLYPKVATNFDIAILVGELDISDNSLMVVKKYPYTITNTSTGALDVDFDIDISMSAGQLIGIHASTHYVYMTAGSPYAGVFDMLFGNSDTFTEGSKLSANPSVAGGKIPLVFFTETIGGQ